MRNSSPPAVPRHSGLPLSVTHWPEPTAPPTCCRISSSITGGGTLAHGARNAKRCLATPARTVLGVVDRVREQIAGALEEVHVLLRSGELHLVALLRWRLVPRRRGTPTHPSRFVVAPRCAIRVARPISWSRSRRQLAHRIERPDEFAPRRIARRGQLRAERFDARRHIRQRIELARQLGDRALGAEAVVRLRRAAPAEVGRHPQRRTDWRPRRFACRRVATRPIRLPASLRARDRRSHRPCSAGPQLKVRREMTTRAEQYFLEQLAPHGTDAKDVVASGYFRTFIRDRSEGETCRSS